MKPQEIQRTLEGLKGNSYNYGNSTHIVQSYTINVPRERFTLKTDQKTFDKRFEDAEVFFSCWMTITEQTDKRYAALVTPAADAEPPAAVQPSVPSVDGNADKATANELVNILKDNITKIQKDKSYIPQAVAICNNVTQIINVERLKLDMVKQMKKTTPV